MSIVRSLDRTLCSPLQSASSYQDIEIRAEKLFAKRTKSAGNLLFCLFVVVVVALSLLWRCNEDRNDSQLLYLLNLCDQIWLGL